MRRMVSPRSIFLVFWLGMAARPCSAADADPGLKRKFGLGVSYLGGDVHYGFKKHWAAELRYFMDAASSDNGDVSSKVFVARVLRSFRTEKHLQTYTGLEGGPVWAKPKDSS